MKFENIEDKCRYYQGLNNYRLMPNSFVIVHCDGRSFSKLIKNKFKKPFDKDFISMMNETAQFLCENVACCKVGYVQSDEITLILSDLDNDRNGEYMFGGRLCKLQSIIASMATGKFNQLLTLYYLKKEDFIRRIEDDDTVYTYGGVTNLIQTLKPAQFDCKVWNVPNANDAYAWIHYRQIDCVRNSKQQAAQTYLSHKELHGLDTDKQIELLKEKYKIAWDIDYNDGEKYGRFVIKDNVHMQKEINGKLIEFDRNIWKSIYAYPLTDDDNRETFKTLVPILNS